MQYITMILVATLGVLLIYRVVSTQGTPDFALKGTMTLEELRPVVAELARNSRHCRPRGSGLSLRSISQRIERTYRHLRRRAASGQELFEYEHWLCDNQYIFAERCQSVRRALRGFFRLPHTARYPRLYQLVSTIVKHLGGAVNAQSLDALVSTYNQQTPLTYPEMVALPSMLDYCLLEYVAIFALRCVASNHHIECGRIDAQRQRVDLSRLGSMSYVFGLSSGDSAEFAYHLSHLCIDNGVTLGTRLANFSHQLEHYHTLVSATIRTMHQSRAWLTERFVSMLSPVGRLLAQRVPNYAQLTDSTRNTYLHQIWRRSRRRNISELGVATYAIDQAQATQRDISFQILPSPIGPGLQRIYVLCLLGFSVGFCTVVALLIGGNLGWVFGALCLPATVCWASVLSSRLITHLAKPPQMPLIEVKRCDGENTRAVIVMPTLATDTAQIERDLLWLETVYCANKYAQIPCVLLVDFAPSPSAEISSEQQAMMSFAREFCCSREGLSVYFRARTQRLPNGNLIGWERKRGALLELGRHLLGDCTEFAEIINPVSAPTYVIALDSDTFLANAIELVGAMQHPFNAGYNVLNLSMRTQVNPQATGFAALFGGARGADAYSMHIGSLESDICGVGNFSGKGILRLREFVALMTDALPDQRILSHDYIEGAIAGCAQSDTVAFESFPQTSAACRARDHRWIRGDWQLLPYLLPRRRNRHGVSVPNNLAPIAKWHLALNLFGSLVSPLALLATFSAIWIPRGHYLLLGAWGYWLCLLALELPHLCRRPGQTLGALARFVLTIAYLPLYALMVLNAVCVTILRLIVRRDLLEWTTSAHFRGRVRMAPAVLTGMALVAMTLFLMPEFWAGYLVVGGLMILVPAFDLMLSRPTKRQKRDCPELDMRLRRLAESTWRFFGHLDNAKHNYLPCDNYQQNIDRWALRTSPTNIGMSLVATICAKLLRITDPDQASQTIGRVLDTLQRMPKWHGHIYNWTDITSLHPLLPKYISSVDSANLWWALVLVSTCMPEHSTRARELALNMDFCALYDTERGLLRIGYDHSADQLSQHYDLMASEALSAYLAAIASGQIPPSALSRLSRSALRTARGAVLASWSGGMFEYLMPSLWLDYGTSPLLSRSAVNAVAMQRAYARSRQMSLWGISECQFGATDPDGNFQYRAHGVPQLAAGNIEHTGIVSAYASLLALPFGDLQAICENLQRLPMGDMGAYESFDTATDQTMLTYMCHHQGMIMAALTNHLMDNVLHDLLSRSGMVRAVQTLLNDDDAPLATARRKFVVAHPSVRRAHFLQKVTARHRHPVPNLCSNSSYHMVIDERGRGYSVIDGLHINRWEGERDIGGVELVASIDNSQINLYDGTATHLDGMSVFELTGEQLGAVTVAAVLPDINAEIRHITLHNPTANPLRVRLSARVEPCLRERKADLSHTAFSDMFVNIEFDAKHDMLTARRTDSGSKLFYALKLFGARATYEGSKSNTWHRVTDKHFGQTLNPVCSVSAAINIQPHSDCVLTVVQLVGYDTATLDAGINRIDDAYLSRVMHPTAPVLGERTRQLAAQLLFPAPRHGGQLELLRSRGVDLRRPSILLGGRGGSLERLSDDLQIIAPLLGYAIGCNIIIIFSERHSYFCRTKDGINRILDRMEIRKKLSSCQALHLFNLVDQPAELLETLEQVCLSPLESTNPLCPQPTAMTASPRYAPVPLASVDYQLQSGLGGWLADSSYVLDLTHCDTPQPWANVLADSQFGTIVTESGGGYTWAHNSRESRLTRIDGDRVADRVTEGLVISEADCIWSVTKRPITRECEYRVTHSLDQTLFETNFNAIHATQAVSVCNGTKVYRIDLANQTKHKRRLQLMFFADMVLGDHRCNTRHSIQISRTGQMLRAHSPVNDLTAYCGSSHPIVAWGASRETFCDASGQIVTTWPSADVVGVSPCACFAVDVQLAPEGQQTVWIWLGTHPEPDLNAKLGAPQSILDVTTPDHALNHLCKWLPHQVASSRMRARAGYYQQSGAYGFRDQLQDCLAMLYVDPGAVREHILECCRHQFQAGDVQHWWHPARTGVRTHFCDDRLFLPYVVAEYVRFVGDRSILAQRTTYLTDVYLAPSEPSAYCTPSVTERRGSVLEHCLRAIEVSCNFGANGLVRMGGGDWLDAMDLVGAGGEGTSVWASMFLYDVINRFVPLLDDPPRAKSLLGIANQLRDAVNTHAWDGEWFVRAFTDDGRVLGSRNSPECRIDLLTQSWAVLSGITSPQRMHCAMQCAYERLVDTELGIVKLFDPPIVDMPNIGYINNYPPGVRENGGQYTHAAVWFAMALLSIGQTKPAHEVIQMLNPATHCATPCDVERYRVEPYVICADVYGHGQLAGRGGWSWYTGAAGWMYRLIVERVLGVTISDSNVLSLQPNLPPQWARVRLGVRLGEHQIDLEIDNTAQSGEWQISIDGVSFNTHGVTLTPALCSKRITLRRVNL